MKTGVKIVLECDMCGEEISPDEGQYPITDYEGNLSMGFNGDIEECPRCSSKKFNLLIE